jgi:hypothetical protein
VALALEDAQELLEQEELLEEAQAQDQELLSLEVLFEELLALEVFSASLFEQACSTSIGFYVSQAAALSQTACSM